MDRRSYPEASASLGKGPSGEGKIGRRARLDTIDRLRREAVRVYWEAKAGTVDMNSQQGRRLIASLVDIVGMVERGDLELRIRALEERLSGKDY